MTMERYFYNMQIFSDELFKNMEIPDENGWFFPLAYKKRESAWT